MRKITTLLITLIIISVGLFSGCTKDKVPINQQTSDNKNIIGVWANVTTYNNLTSGVNRSTMLVYNFTDTRFNYSGYYIIGIHGSTKDYYSFSEGTYELKDGNLILTNATKVPPLKYSYQYSFNNNYTALTLTNSSGLYVVFLKL